VQFRQTGAAPAIGGRIHIAEPLHGGARPGRSRMRRPRLLRRQAVPLLALGAAAQPPGGFVPALPASVSQPGRLGRHTPLLSAGSPPLTLLPMRFELYYSIRKQAATTTAAAAGGADKAARCLRSTKRPCSSA